MTGLLASGLEGAIDAAFLEHTDGDALPPEVHNRHLGHEHDAGAGHDSGVAGDHGHAHDSGPDHHRCHCSIHVPPLAFGLTFASLHLGDDHCTAALHSHDRLSGPPPLPPPIV
jgi:hypothetical protein